MRLPAPLTQPPRFRTPARRAVGASPLSHTEPAPGTSVAAPDLATHAQRPAAAPAIPNYVSLRNALLGRSPSRILCTLIPGPPRLLPDALLGRSPFRVLGSPQPRPLRPLPPDDPSPASLPPPPAPPPLSGYRCPTPCHLYPQTQTFSLAPFEAPMFPIISRDHASLPTKC